MAYFDLPNFLPDPASAESDVGTATGRSTRNTRSASIDTYVDIVTRAARSKRKVDLGTLTSGMRCLRTTRMTPQAGFVNEGHGHDDAVSDDAEGNYDEEHQDQGLALDGAMGEATTPVAIAAKPAPHASPAAQGMLTVTRQSWIEAELAVLTTTTSLTEIQSEFALTLQSKETIVAELTSVNAIRAAGDFSTTSDKLLLDETSVARATQAC
ncbi:uncharacterized protein FTOL_12979 [Fusarium torulosum]|uniref:Uncharacterized protein n=1 Tax=Fusarium torulosum TaxID=33205 RepID=A0AAE8MLU1_9HYPO|nr:uncharacterized protein FTOL_12979 [Fusarium torulosum]